MHCKDCKYAELESITHQFFCNNSEKINDCDYFYHEENKDKLVYTYHEGGSFCVGPLFGCVHFEKHDRSDV